MKVFNARLTIGRRIGLGFGIILLLALVNFVLTFRTLYKSRALTDSIINVYTPSVDALEDLNVLVLNTNMLINNWVHVQSGENNYDKTRLLKIINDDYPKLKKHVRNLGKLWEKDDRAQVDLIFEKIDKLLVLHKSITVKLNSFASYEDPMILFELRNLIEGGEVDELTKEVLMLLSKRISKDHQNTKRVSNEMIESFNIVQAVVRNSGVLLLLGGMLIAFFTFKSIVNPIYELKEILIQVGKGILPKEKIRERDDEIGEMSAAMGGLVDGLKRTTEFSREVGAGNFKSDYQPLSDKDVLGQSLLVMRTELSEFTSHLEKKVIERTEEIERQKVEIEEKNHKLQELYTAVTDSIVYSKRIQQSILPPDVYVKRSLPDSFILYKPKDIVSGDFYWFDKKKDAIYIAAVDCTGHGVPGALMSIIGNNIMNESINSKDNILPGNILDDLNYGVTKTLRLGQPESGGAKDGMDITLCRIDYKNNIMQFAAAYNPLYIIKNGEFSEIKANKFPIGYYAEDPEMKYTTHEISIKKGDVFYLFTDGYADQFGGPAGKKFMYKKFREKLIDIHTLPMSEQGVILNTVLENWKGDLDQIDDILVIGFRI